MTTTGSGSPPDEARAKVADTFGRIEATHIGPSGGPYITSGDVHRETANALLTMPLNALAGAMDPLGIAHFVAATLGLPTAPRVFSAIKDPKNISAVPVAAAGLVIAIAGAKSPVAAEGGGGGIGGALGGGGGGGGPVARFIAGPGGSVIETGLTPTELLMPGGVRLGQAGASSGIRVIQGGATEAGMMFEQLGAGGTPYVGDSLPAFEASTGAKGWTW